VSIDDRQWSECMARLKRRDPYRYEIIMAGVPVQLVNTFMKLPRVVLDVWRHHESDQTMEKIRQFSP